MGMDADVIAIGPFSQDIIDMLDYPAEYYQDTKPGTIVITTVFGAPTTKLSNLLASAMGVDPWDFNTHKIDPKNVTKGLNELTEFALRSGDDILIIREIFDKLVEKDFTFFFRPNG